MDERWWTGTAAGSDVGSPDAGWRNVVVGVEVCWVGVAGLIAESPADQIALLAGRYKRGEND